MAESNEEFFDELQKYRSQSKVIEFYDKYARDYDNALAANGYGNITDLAALLLKELFLEDCKASKSIESYEILDVGCGSGMTGVALQNAGFQSVDGVDPSPGMIRMAEEKKIYRNLFNGKLAENEKFGIPNDQYDGLLCVGCIAKDHINVEHAVPEFLRLVRPGGIAVYTVSPTLDKIKALEKHLNYFAEEERGKFQLLKVQRKYYVDQKYKQGNFCHLYGVKKNS